MSQFKLFRFELYESYIKFYIFMYIFLSTERVINNETNTIKNYTFIISNISSLSSIYREIIYYLKYFIIRGILCMNLTAYYDQQEKL